MNFFYLLRHYEKILCVHIKYNFNKKVTSSKNKRIKHTAAYIRDKLQQSEIKYQKEKKKLTNFEVMMAVKINF